MVVIVANRKYSEEFKKNIVKLYKNGNSVKKISENYNIPKSNIIAWSKKFQEIQINNKENITVKEIIDLKKELQKLIEENSILIDLDDIYEKKDIERKVKFISDNKEATQKVHYKPVNNSFRELNKEDINNIIKLIKEKN